ncbi:sodium:solute symporter [Dysgonomonas sp. 511]|uniref:sodium:solute symporter n=1 Tax=Dysgonomonas sp. 511 TaxID=2302930 RepID=UPI0013D3D0DB|nr:sodium:solute symporter [Dysgonomonas sp. 511]NDV77953.1 sodium:solute symporter [Dysgonomonas sp. 511]
MGTTILIILAVYFGLLTLISHLVSRKNSGNDAFFLGNKKSPWYIVAFGMIGSSISGVSFVSVPGMVRGQDMTYMQMVLGFFVGYAIIAFVLLPLYYRLNLTTIYGYLERRFGLRSYKTGASFFILSKTIGAAARLFLVVFILHNLVFAQWNIPFFAVAAGIIVLIWIYTYRSGIKTIIWTDTLQTFCLVAGLVLIIWQVIAKIDVDLPEAIQMIGHHANSKIFVFDDWVSKQNFFKQFLNGVLIAIVMNGLDQDMMQKSLTCKNLKDAQKNIVTFGALYIPINLLLLSLGVLLLIFASQFDIALPERADQILPVLASQYLGLPVLIFFSIGIIAAAFSSADSALTAITTTVCVDLLDIEKKEALKAVKTRRKIHILISVAFLLVILLIDYLGQDGILNTIYKIASYTYGPLLGLFFLGLFTKVKPKDKIVPIVCILSPLLCFGIEVTLKEVYDYAVGNEILLANGLLTIVGLSVFSEKEKYMAKL